MALFRMLVVAILAEGTPLWDDNCDSCEAGSAFLQLELSKDKAHVISSDLQASRYWFPTKSVDNNRSGQSSVSGPFPLHKPDTAHWELNVPGVVFHQVPMIDDKLNIYMGSDTGKIFSFDKYGAKRWEANGIGTHCQDPSLFEGILYTACRDGSVLALDMMTGQLLWQRKICKELPFEHYSISVTKDHIFLPAGVNQHGGYVSPFHEPLDIGSPAVALLRREDGRLVWRANLSKWNAVTQELTPCMLSDSVIFSGGMGTIFRLSLQNGSLIWKVDVGPNLTTSAQVSCTQDGKVFAGYGGYSGNDANDRHVGGLYALDIKTGDTLWTRSFPYRVYTPVAVGEIQGHKGTAVIVAMGTPGQYPKKTTENHTLWALDANTGAMIWSFNTPSCTALGARGGTLEEMCWPLAWSAPVISKDGIVYINWAFGGVTFALRDINKDGLCDLHNPEEVSSFDFGIGHQGGPALAPGMLVVLTCHGPRAILTAAIEQ